MEKQQMREPHAEGGGRRRNRPDKPSVRQVSATAPTPISDTASCSMEQVVEPANMQKAWQRVKANKGAAGIDGLSIDQTAQVLRTQWPLIKQQLLAGRYQPQPVRRVEIPKPKGGTRKPGIPTVTDRLIQQALHQVLQPIFEREFSDSSYGFRPNRSTHMALCQSRHHINQGHRWVVDMDLEKFFDNVNHDILMAKIARQVKDKRILGVIRRYLQAGVLEGGVVSPAVKGTPQGGPLSPLLSNIMLDTLDKELERRGHQFVRYADDCNIYVRSKVAGERVLASIKGFLSNVLKLKLNDAKSAVDRPWNRSFLGYSFTINREAKLKPPKESVKRFKAKVKRLMRIGRGRNLAKFISLDLNPVVRGWGQYYRQSEVKLVFKDLDGWIRRRLRCMKWRQSKRPWTRRKMLMRRGLSEERASLSAYNGRGPWWNSGAGHMNAAFPKSYFANLNLVTLAELTGKPDWLK